MQQSPLGGSIAQRIVGGQGARRLALVALSVLLATAAFPPLDLGFLAWVALVPLLMALDGCRSAVRAFGWGYLFGIAHWGWTVSWLGTTVVRWSDSWAGWLVWLLLAAIQAGWFGLAGALIWAVQRRTAGLTQVVGIASCWVLVEWLRGQGALSMPWSLLGYTQYRNLAVVQIADLGGVYAVTFVLLWCNAGLAACWRLAFDEDSVRFGQRHTKRALARAMAAAVVPILVAVLYGGVRIALQTEGPSVSLALMQPNSPSSRTEARSLREDLSKYRELGSSLAANALDLVVWPESALQDNALLDPEIRREAASLVPGVRTHHLFGSGYWHSEQEGYNSAFLVDPDGGLAGRYDKQWLVPYGEWVPGRSWLPFTEHFHVFEYDLRAAPPGDPLRVGAMRMGVLICFESIAPGITREHVRRGANLLVCITNDSWAGPSKVMRQHFAMGVLRAVETRRSLAVSAMTGVTGVVRPTGRFRAAPENVPAAFLATPSLETSRTLYVLLGDWLPAGSLLLTVILLLPKRRGRGA